MTSKMNSSKTSFRERLTSLNEHRQSLIKCLAPTASDYGFGGAHRMWVIDSAQITADDYIATLNERAEQMAKLMPNIAITFITTMAIPMPPAWGGVRPAEIEETYGHPHLASKDWRHFENTIRWRCAEKGYFAQCVPLDGYKGIAFYALKMIDVAYGGLNKINAADYEGKKYESVATTKPYDEFCADCDKAFEGSKIAESKAITDQFPPFMRPIIAMGMCE